MVLGSIGFSVWAYHRTNPPIGRGMRFLLTALRTVGLVGGVLLIAQPLLQISRTRSVAPLIGVLIDRSTSMNLKQGGVDRSVQVGRLLASPEFAEFSKLHNVVEFGFSDSLVRLDPEAQSLIAATGPATNIAFAISALPAALQKQAPAAIILISDGANNQGLDPARLARGVRSPIYTIGVGSTAPTHDLMITDVVANPVVYQGSKTPVEVGYSAIGLAGTSFEVILRDDDGDVVARERITVAEDLMEGKVTFEPMVERAGRIQYRVEIPALESELTADNNRRAFYLNALANRMRVLVMAGTPDNALGDLIRRLAADEQIEVTQRTSKGGSFYEGTWPDDALLDRTDVVILHHFPIRKNSPAQLEAFAQGLKRRNLPVCLIDGGDLDGSSLRYFEALLPVAYAGRDATVLSATVKPLRRHSIIAEPDDAGFLQKWTSLPPLKFRSDGYTLQPNAETLAEFNEGGGHSSPALVVMEHGSKKSAAILMRDLWRWGLASPGKDGVTEPLVSRLVRWLAVRKSEKRVQLAFGKEQFTLQEPISISVNVYDENYRPVDQAEVRIRIKSAERDGTQQALQGSGGGQYRGSFQPWGEGEYQVVAEATIDGRNIGSDSGSVIVEPFSIELLNTRMNEPLLRGIAEASGGSYVPADSAGLMFKALKIPPTIEKDEKRMALSGGWVHLLIVVGCLALEWFLRVRQGML